MMVCRSEIWLVNLNPFKKPMDKLKQLLNEVVS